VSGWAQALFTLVIALVFAQLAPVDWRLAEARVLDVAVGAGVGVLIGLFAWPRGGAGELHRATANFLTAGAAVVRETVAVLATAARPGAAIPHARQESLLAEASFALYQTERHPESRVDWQAALIAGHHTVRGAEALLRSCPTGRLLPCETLLSTTADTVARGYERFAAGLRRRDRIALGDPAMATSADEWPTDLGSDLYHLADIRIWLNGLAEDLVRVAAPAKTAEAAVIAP
jgi:uncharacterized membrane protein YccC